mgnify:CR=1 FL=1
MPLNDIYRATVKFSNPVAPTDMVYVLHYQITNAGGQPDGFGEALELAQELVSQTETLYLPFIPNTHTLVGVDVIGVTDPLVQATWNSGVTGSDADQAVSLRNAVCVNWKTGVRGRSYDGGSNLMAPSESQQDSGVILPSYITDITPYLANIDSLLRPNLDEFSLGIYSRKLGVFTPVTTFIVRSTFSTVKSRQPVT